LLLEVTMHLHLRPLFASLALAASGASLAGTVSVTYINAPNFADAGNTIWEAEQNLVSLQRYLELLGKELLPADQTLKIEVLDVDLAGTVEVSRRDGSEVRILRGRTDFPRMHVRFALDSGGQTLRTGDDWLANIHYVRGFARWRDDVPLAFEKNMLLGWFKQRFAPEAAPPQ
jgi:hypothetical protein